MPRVGARGHGKEREKEARVWSCGLGLRLRRMKSAFLCTLNEDMANCSRADGRWLTLTNALSGLFCASLNFIDSTRTIRPVMSFDPVGDHPNSTVENLHLLHGTLPREVVCTENLTPFLKLLPCKGKAGISSLLDGHKLFDASWQSMSIDVQPICPSDGGECHLQITQTIDMVLDIQRSKRPRGMYVARGFGFLLILPRQSHSKTSRIRRAQMQHIKTLPFPQYLLPTRHLSARRRMESLPNIRPLPQMSLPPSNRRYRPYLHQRPPRPQCLHLSWCSRTQRPQWLQPLLRACSLR